MCTVLQIVFMKTLGMFFNSHSHNWSTWLLLLSKNNNVAPTTSLKITTHDTIQIWSLQLDWTHVLIGLWPTTALHQKKKEVETSIAGGCSWRCLMVCNTDHPHNRSLRRYSHEHITNFFEQCYIPFMPIHARMQQIHLIVIKYLSLHVSNKWKLGNHQQPVIPT